MAKVKEPVNPFYVLLVIAGIVFFVTAFAYGAMTYVAMQPAGAGQDITKHQLWSFLNDHGMQLMGIELGVLAAATFLAMWLDGFRTRQKADESALDLADRN